MLLASKPSSSHISARMGALYKIELLRDHKKDHSFVQILFSRLEIAQRFLQIRNCTAVFASKWPWNTPPLFMASPGHHKRALFMNSTPTHGSVTVFKNTEKMLMLLLLLFVLFQLSLLVPLCSCCRCDGYCCMDPILLLVVLLL